MRAEEDYDIGFLDSVQLSESAYTEGSTFFQVMEFYLRPYREERFSLLQTDNTYLETSFRQLTCDDRSNSLYASLVVQSTYYE